MKDLIHRLVFVVFILLLHLKRFCLSSIIWHEPLQLDITANNDHLKTSEKSAVFKEGIGLKYILYPSLFSVYRILLKFGKDDFNKLTILS